MASDEISSAIKGVEERVKELLRSYREFIISEQGQAWIRERDERHRKYRELFSRDNIDNLTEEDIAEVIAELWANAGWTNKQYIVERVLRNNKLEDLKQAFKKLLWSEEPLGDRFDEFFKKVKNIGLAAATEIACFTKPDEFFIWNERCREGLRALGLDKVVPVNKYRLRGQEYEKVVELGKRLSRLMSKEGVGQNLIDVDIFLYSLITGQLKTTLVQPIQRIEEDYDFDHDEIVEKLVEIGNSLGFEAEEEVLISSGARVDVVWRANIGVLSSVEFVFEVHKSGSLDSAVLNLLRAKGRPTVQRLIIVSNTKGINVFKKEISSLPEEFRKIVAYLEAKEVLEASSLIRRINEILITKLNLTV
ncbi:MAG: hypothetical protein QXW58_07000 [Thermosphaera sp.]